MKKVLFSALMCLAVSMLFTAPTKAAEVKSLRGDLEIMSPANVPDLPKLEVVDKFERNFKSQPPLIPHKSEKYNISLNSNKCLKCHDKKNYKEEEAPMAGPSHYIGADGKEGDKLNMGRYFCNQCHVTQTLSKELVENTFTSK
ncbi:MAG: nitrate reductase cytochrome c-type subunit [Rhodospirillales bacterium]|nr:nitrate reductase cytochrome c-type subunit [Rhodospirillales bacterium]